MKVACHLGLGHYKEALDIAEIVLKSKPGDLSGGLYKAYTEEALGMSEKEIETINRCIGNNPNDANCRRIKLRFWRVPEDIRNQSSK